MDDKQVCGECKLFTNEDSFGNGWCEFHKKYSFCENVAVKMVKQKGKVSLLVHAENVTLFVNVV